MDEFDLIARLLRPLAAGSPEALGLMDDAAVLPSRSGFDLVVTKDALVEGVHFLADDAADLVARKLLRVNLSDLAAKGAEPYGYLLACAWPNARSDAWKAAFVTGLALDQATFGLKLFGGDTVSAPGPAMFSATMMGWVAAGRMVRRSGARAGDLVLVSGVIGDGTLGLEAARGGLTDLPGSLKAALAARYRLPQPRGDLAAALLAHASAAADVSDGLLADAGHIGEASSLGVDIALDRLPLSEAAQAWIAMQPDRTAALLRLAAGGDDYEVVCTASPEAASHLGDAVTGIGQVVEGQGVRATCNGEPVTLDRLGWRHP